MGWFVVYPNLILLHLFLLFNFPSYTFSLCNPHDFSALLLFNNSFTVDNTLANYYCPTNVSPKTASWNKNTDCCEWDGVTCDTMSGHVTGLDLSCNMLQGQFHPNTTLFHLTHLQKLNLALNYFDGSSLYSGIGDLPYLTHLNLSSSGFQGDIPSSLSHLSRLVSLDLTYNDMRLDPSTWNKLIINASDIREIFLDYTNMSSIDTSSLSLLLNLTSSLVSLSLQYTELQKNFPSGILCLPNLEELALAGNDNLRGQLPNSNWTSPLRHLDLSGTSFSGAIPDCIGKLKSLNRISLRHCEFDGMIPSSLWNITQLTSLSLSYNNLTGEIPPIVSNLEHLTLLELSYNHLEGQIPPSLFNSTQLFELILSHNKLVGPIPSKINKQQKLQHVDLSVNLLNGTIPSWCFSLPSLSKLYISDNQLTGSISEFSTYSFSDLDFSNNKLQGNFPTSIYEFENLTTLVLSSNNLSGLVDFEQFTKFQNLYHLDLSYNKFLSININNSVDHLLLNLAILKLSSCTINNTFPKFLARLQNLVVLGLSGCKIHGNIPKWFYENLLHSWSDIEYIDLSFNQLEGVLPIPPGGNLYFYSVSNNNLSGDISSTICNASSLFLLNLSHNNLSGMIPQCLGNVSSLFVLDLQRNNLHGHVPMNFFKGNNLETIKLNGNRLEGALPQSLVDCKNLQVLGLGDNNIVDIFPTWLETLPELQVLVLRSNKFHGVITCSSTKNPFPKLRIFDVSINHFSGPLPASCIKNFQGMMNVNDSQTGLKYISNDIGAYNRLLFYYNDSVVVIIKDDYRELVRISTRFTSVDLSNNMFEGDIPTTIGKLSSLIGLNLSHNGINGTIPQSLGDMTSLEWLDLSGNQLSGEIPMTLMKLNFLSVLNLAQNQLKGMIPKGGQFNTFENVSYEGNPMLCGFPLSKSCNKDGQQPPQLTSHHEEESSFIGWKSIVVGYVSGVVFGMGLAYGVFFTGKPQWLARLLGAIP